MVIQAMTIGEALKEGRHLVGWSQEELVHHWKNSAGDDAKGLGTLRRWEQSRYTSNQRSYENAEPKFSEVQILFTLLNEEARRQGKTPALPDVTLPPRPEGTAINRPYSAPIPAFQRLETGRAKCTNHPYAVRGSVTISGPGRRSGGRRTPTLGTVASHERSEPQTRLYQHLPVGRRSLRELGRSGVV